MAERTVGLPADVDVGALGVALLEAARGAHIGVAVALVQEAKPTIIYASEALAEIIGWPAEEILVTNPMTLIAPDEIPRVYERFLKRAQGETGQMSYQLTVIRKDGQRTSIDVAASAATLSGRRAVVAFITDASVRIRAEDERQRTEARFREVIENAPEPIGIIRDGYFVYSNSAFVKVLGRKSPEDLYRTPISQILPPDEFKEGRARERGLWAGDRFGPRIYHALRPDGSIVQIEVNSSSFSYEGKPGVLTMARDVTDKKLLEARLIQADRLAAIGTMAAGVAHEINNPLAYVMLNLDWIVRKLPDAMHDPASAEALTEMLREAHRGTERVASIVRELRTFARADSESRQRVDLVTVVESANKIAGHEVRHRAKVTTSFEAVGAVWANESRLEQVVLNLMLNASHAMPESRAETNEIRIVVRPEGSRGAVLEVSDNGEGIAPEILPRIFDPFFSTKPRGVGMGLGLSICHGIVTSLGGQITVHSVPSEGTTFRVVLPTTDEPAEAVETHPTPPPLSGRARRARVLVIDDEVPIVNTMRELLGASSDVTATTSAREALAAIETHEFDVILCDLMMPEKSGIEFYQQLRTERPELARRVVFMTGGAFTARAAEFLASIENRRVEKPFSLALIERIVREVADR